MGKTSKPSPQELISPLPSRIRVSHGTSAYDYECYVRLCYCCPSLHISRYALHIILCKYRIRHQPCCTSTEVWYKQCVVSERARALVTSVPKTVHSTVLRSSDSQTSKQFICRWWAAISRWIWVPFRPGLSFSRLDIREIFAISWDGMHFPNWEFPLWSLRILMEPFSEQFQLWIHSLILIFFVYSHPFPLPSSRAVLVYSSSSSSFCSSSPSSSSSSFRQATCILGVLRRTTLWATVTRKTKRSQKLWRRSNSKPDKC